MLRVRRIEMQLIMCNCVRLGTLIAVLTVVIMFMKFSIQTYAINGDPWEIHHARRFVTFIITGITVLVVAVPEGLPLAVTLSLAYSVKVRT